MPRSTACIFALVPLIILSPLFAAEPPVKPVPVGSDLSFHPLSGEILLHADNNDFVRRQVQGFNAWVAVPRNPANQGPSVAYFKAPDSLRNLPAGHPVSLEITYFDQAPGEYTMTYDAQGSASGKALAPIVTTGTNRWMSVRWNIPDAVFAGGLRGADLKLEASGTLPLTVLGIDIATDYHLTADSHPQPGVPVGDVIRFQFDHSKIYPGTTREVTVYVPKQYDGVHPACVWFDEDGLMWNNNVVLDNLIAHEEVPVMVAIGITPGSVPHQGRQGPRNNRQYEYDVVNDNYARFLREEIYPAVEALKTPDGRAIKLSRDGNDCGISGASSGGICSFNAAWQRPDEFTRVFSAIGSFDDLQGGDRFPDYVRKTEPKPIRVFMQDGTADLNWFGGDWWMANQKMYRALLFAGYEVEHVWGDRGHDVSQATMVFPDALRFLWRGWPAPVKNGYDSNTIFHDLFPKETWKQVWQGDAAPPALAANARGRVFFNAGGKCYEIDDAGNVSQYLATAAGDAGEAFGSDGRLYQVDQAGRRIVAYDSQGNASAIVANLRAQGIAALPHNRFYVTEPGLDGAPSRIWLIGADGSKKIVDTESVPVGAISADGPAFNTVEFGDTDSPWVSVADIQPDGTLLNQQRYYELEAPITEPSAAAKAIALHPGANSMVATSLGVQINSGVWVKGISPVPGGPVTALTVGGSGFDTLYVVSGNKIYARATNFRGGQPPPN